MTSWLSTQAMQIISNKTTAVTKKSKHDTFNRVFSQIDPKQFQKCFNNLMKELSSLVKGEIVSIDGKTLRGSSCDSSNQKAIHMVSVWANENQVVLGQIKTEDKSNEITSIPKLLELLELKKYYCYY